MNTVSINQLAVTVGDLVQQNRLKQGLSQKDLANRMGTTKAEVSNVEMGNRDMRVSTLMRYAIALQVNPSSLLPAVPRESA